MAAHVLGIYNTDVTLPVLGWTLQADIQQKQKNENCWVQHMAMGQGKGLYINMNTLDMGCT